MSQQKKTCFACDSDLTNDVILETVAYCGECATPYCEYCWCNNLTFYTENKSMMMSRYV